MDWHPGDEIPFPRSAALRGLTQEEQKAQAERCPCRGSDDYCPCQNAPDAITRKEWGLEPARRDNTYTLLAARGNPSIPTAMFNVADLLRQIANGRDPNDDIAGAPLLAYWQRTAKTFLPALVEPSPLDEPFHRLLDFARSSAIALRQLRQEYRSPSANFPTSVPIPYAQDAADVIERLVGAIEARAVAAPPPPVQQGEAEEHVQMFVLPNGLEAVCIGGRWGGWLMWRHPDGQWISKAKLVEIDPSEGLPAAFKDLASNPPPSHEERLREALEEIAGQRTSAEHADDSGHVIYGDFVAGYDGCVNRARRALSHADGDGNG